MSGSSKLRTYTTRQFEDRDPEIAPKDIPPLGTLTDAEIDARIERASVARLATIDSRGDPHLVPIVFARVGGVLWSPVDGKPKRRTDLTRLENVAAHPRVSLLIDHYDDNWRALWWIRIDGDAQVVTNAELSTQGLAA